MFNPFTHPPPILLALCIRAHSKTKLHQEYCALLPNGASGRHKVERVRPILYDPALFILVPADCDIDTEYSVHHTILLRGMASSQTVSLLLPFHSLPCTRTYVFVHGRLSDF